MGKWTELARQLSDPSSDRDVSDNSAISPPRPAKAAPIDPNVTNDTAPMPVGIAAGLAALRTMAAPRITRPEVWPGIVADAVRLVDEGWAAKALALGWEPAHLWGCSPDKGGNPDHDGLAVLLAGRQIVMLDEAAAIMESRAGTHRLFNLRPMAGAIMLWELGEVVRDE